MHFILGQLLNGRNILNSTIHWWSLFWPTTGFWHADRNLDLLQLKMNNNWNSSVFKSACKHCQEKLGFLPKACDFSICSREGFLTVFSETSKSVTVFVEKFWTLDYLSNHLSTIDVICHHVLSNEEMQWRQSNIHALGLICPANLHEPGRHHGCPFLCLLHIAHAGVMQIKAFATSNWLC